MFLDVLQTNLQKIVNFFGYLMAYFRRHNLLQSIANQIVTVVKDYLTMNRKLKMAKYRVNYNKHKLSKMEALIAESNEHTFLKGRNLNQLR